MRVLKATVVFILLVAPAAAGKSRTEFHDFSLKGADYRPLENLRFAAYNVSYVGVEQTEVLGRQYAASKYEVRAAVRVQIMCALGAVSTEVYRWTPAVFEVFVVEDGDRGVHDKLARGMYALWNRGELSDGARFYDFDIRKEKYLLTSVPTAAEEKEILVVWVNGRAVKAVFKSLVGGEGGGWGVKDAFALENMRVRVGEAEFTAYRYPLGFQKTFGRLYERGFFTNAGAPAEQSRR